jgi:hypothetical protein
VILERPGHGGGGNSELAGDVFDGDLIELHF